MFQNGKTPAEIYEDPELLPGEVVLDKLMAMLERKPRLTKKKKGEIEVEEEQAIDQTGKKVRIEGPGTDAIKAPT